MKVCDAIATPKSRPSSSGEGRSIDLTPADFQFTRDGFNKGLMMADEETTEQATTAIKTADIAAAEPKKKPHSAETPKTKAKPATSKSVNKKSTALSAGPRRYSDSERSAKLVQIKNSVAEGTTLKAAVKDSGISMQTYYHWKRAAAAAPVGTVSKPAPQASAFADLVELEKENQKLRAQLAEKLRVENAELRKRLGMK